MTKVLSLDPGGTTGYSWCELSEDKKVIPEFHGGQIGPGKHHRDLWQLLQSQKWDIVICESFEYRMVAIDDAKTGNVYSPHIELVSKEYIGVVELWTATNGKECTVVFQKPAQAVGKKTFWTIEKMTKMLVYKKGEKHRNDASRHLLYWMNKNGYTAILGRLRK